MPSSDHDQRHDYDDQITAAPQPKIPERSPFLKNPVATGVVLGVVVVVVIALMDHQRNGFRAAAGRIKSSHNLKQIGLAFHNYAETYGEFPNNTFDHNGKPLLSWRVHILPFVEQEALYHRFKLDEPWDSPNNLPLLQQIPRLYEPTTGRRGGLTYYRGFSNPGAVFEPRINDRKLFSFDAVKDGLSNTIFVVEAGDAVEWTIPDGLDASPDKPFPKLGGMRWRSGEFQAVMGDGSVRSFAVDTDESKLRALISHSGGETVPD